MKYIKNVQKMDKDTKKQAYKARKNRKLARGMKRTGESS